MKKKIKIKNYRQPDCNQYLLCLNHYSKINKFFNCHRCKKYIKEEYSPDITEIAGCLLLNFAIHYPSEYQAFRAYSY